MSHFKYHYNLCECGNPKKDTSKRCRVCSSANPSKSKSNSYDICPSCGGPKGKRGKLCRSCRFPNIDPNDLEHRPWYGVSPDYSCVPEDFLRALSGFLMGEGCVTVGHYPNWSPRIDIGIHIDDLETLKVIQDYLGGSIHIHSNRPLATWRLQGLLPVRELLLLVREYSSSLKAIKLNDVDLVLGYIEWRLSKPHHLSAEDKVEQLSWKSSLHLAKVRSKL